MRILSLVTSDHAKFYKQQIAGLRDRGHTVRTLSVSGTKVKDGVDKGGRSVSAYVRFYPRAMASALGSYDIVHANYGLTGPPAVAQPFRPTVLSLWGSDLMGTYSTVSTFCSRFADEVVVMSDEMDAALGCECHVIPHGIDLQRFKPQPQAEARDALGWDDETRYVLFPYSPSRSIKDFPRAERIVESARRDLDEPVEIKTMSNEPHERVPLYMNAADALVLSSKREGSPNTVKEALACNLPVVSVDVGDVDQQLAAVSPSAVSSDDTELAAALVEILTSVERSNGRDAVAHLAVERQLDRLEAVYESVLSTGGGR